MFEKNQSTRGFGTGEMRLVFQQALQKSPDQASAKTPPDVKKQLEALEAEVSMQAVDLAASKDYDKVVQLKTHEWGVDAAKDQEAIQVVKTVFKTLSPDKLEILTTNLLAGNVDAKASFQRIINILYEKHNVVGDTSHQLDQLTNNQVAKGAVGLIENFKESYHRESGLGKAILIGAIFMAGKILFDKDIRAKESPFGMSYGDLFKLVGAGIGLNYLYGAVHPEKKTLMEQIGLSKMDQQVPENVRLMAKQAGIETPEQLAALTQINLFGAKEMKTWVDLYKQNKGAGYISPETYPFHYTDMDDASKRQRGRDLYVFIEHMMKEANGGEFVGMEDKFVGRYCSPEKNYTFTSIVMDIQSRAGTKMDFAGDTASESFKQRAAADLGPVLQDFGPDFGGFASSEYKVKLKSVPVTYIPSSVDDKGKVTEYNLKFPNGQIVKIASAGLSPSIKSHIDTLLVEDIKRRIQISPELQGKTPVWNGSKWEISNVTIGGVVNGSVFVEAMPNDDGFTMTFANMAISGHPSRTVTVLTGARTLNVMLQNDVYAYRVDGYEVGGKRPFAGLDIFVERTEDQTNDFVEIFGEIEGAKFRAKYNKGTNKFVEFTGNFRDEKFTNAKIEKVQSVNAEINQKFGDLAGLAEQANEQWARWDFWNSNLEGSINEAYWKYLCAFKVREAWTMYKSRLETASDPEDIVEAEKIIAELAGKAEKIKTYIKGRITPGTKITKEEFEQWIEVLDTFQVPAAAGATLDYKWYGNDDYEDFMKRIRNKLYGIDYRGDESSKIMMLIHMRVSDGTRQFATLKRPLDPSEKAYLAQVEGAVGQLVQKAESTKPETWQGIGTIWDALPGFSYVLGRDHGFFETWRGVYENIDDGVKSGDVYSFLNVPRPATSQPAANPSDPALRETEKGSDKLNKWGVDRRVMKKYYKVYGAARALEPANLNAPQAGGILKGYFTSVVSARPAEVARIAALTDRFAQDAALEAYYNKIVANVKFHLNPAGIVKFNSLLP